MTQIARPISDITVNGWTTEPLWSKVNDASDATYITGPVGSGTLCEVKLASLSDPVGNTGHAVYIRARVANGAYYGEELRWDLYQGAEVIAFGLSTTISRTTITTYSHTLTAAETDSITDYTDLRVCLLQSEIAGGENISVYDVWMECPGIDAAPITTSTVAAAVAVPTPTITTFSPATPDAIATTVAIPTPTLTGGSSLETTTVAAAVAVPSPDIPIPESPTVYPDTVALGLGIGDNWSAVATATTGGAGEVTAYRVCVDAYIPLITVAAGAGTAPDTVSVLADIPAPVLSGGADVTGATVAAIVAIPAPAVSTADPDAVVTPTTVAASVGVPAPTITAIVMISVTVTPATVAAVAAMPTATVVTHHKRRHRGPIVSALERKYKM